MSTPEKLQPPQDFNGLPDPIEDLGQMLNLTNAILGMTRKPEAVADWWLTPNHYLDDETPASVWPARAREVLELADSYRDQGAD